MIIEYTIGNFLSIKDRQTLSLVAEPPFNTLPQNLLDTPDENLKLLKFVVIYGANAAGKSNFVLGLDKIKELVLNSVNHKPNQKIKIIPFLLDKQCLNSPSYFSIKFFCQDIKYEYTLEIDTNKVHFEQLQSYPKKYKRNIFQRVLNEDGSYTYNFGSDLKPKRIFDDIAFKTAQNVLFLSKAVKENSLQLKPVYDWFLKNLLDEFSFQETAKLVHTDQYFKEAVTNFLSDQDIAITGLKTKESSLSEKFSLEAPDLPDQLKTHIIENMKDELVYEVSSIHRNNENEEVSFGFGLESNGTHKLFTLAPMLFGKDKSTFYFDEMSSALHPNLVKNLVKKFVEYNNQLIGVTHDTHLLDSSLLRKDQIYFVEKDQNQSSSIYSLLEFKPRNDRESWELRYLSGRYGATPFLE